MTHLACGFFVMTLACRMPLDHDLVSQILVIFGHTDKMPRHAVFAAVHQIGGTDCGPQGRARLFQTVFSPVRESLASHILVPRSVRSTGTLSIDTEGRFALRMSRVGIPRDDGRSDGVSLPERLGQRLACPGRPIVRCTCQCAPERADSHTARRSGRRVQRGADHQTLQFEDETVGCSRVSAADGCP